MYRRMHKCDVNTTCETETTIDWTHLPIQHWPCCESTTLCVLHLDSNAVRAMKLLRLQLVLPNRRQVLQPSL